MHSATYRENNIDIVDALIRCKETDVNAKFKVFTVSRDVE